MTFDWHVHPDYSPDATGSMREYCEQARRIGLGGLCFTTHYEPDPARADREHVRVDSELVPVTADWTGRYFADIAAVRREFPDLLVLAGVEIGFEPGLEGLVREFLDRHRFQFVLGSVHSIDHLALSSQREQDEFVERFRDVPAGDLMGRYFDRVRAAAASGLFDSLAHLDIYRKYVLKRLGPGLEEAAAENLPGALAVLARAGVALEVNTSAFRRGDDEPYPAVAILEQARQAGVTRFTVGSDAHRPGDLGTGLDRARALLARLGAQPLTPPGRGGARAGPPPPLPQSGS